MYSSVCGAGDTGKNHQPVHDLLMTVSAFVSVMLFGVFKKIRYKLLIHSSVCSWCSGRVHLVSVGLRIIEDSLKSP